MSDEIESLRAEVAALRAELAESTERDRDAITRRRVLAGLFGAGAATAAGIATAPPALAGDGDTVTVGADNIGETTTILRRGTIGELPGPAVDEDPTLRVESELGTALVVAAPDGMRVAGEGDGVRATAWQAVVGESNGIVGVAGVGTDGATGMYATSDTGPGLIAASSEGANVLLEPASTSGPPPFWGQDVGAIRADSDAELWLCVAVAGDGTGTWTRLLREDTAPGRTVPITPFRALDTRATGGRPSGSPAVPGQVKGPLKGGQTVTLDLGGVDPIPASATGVIGTVIAVSPTYTGYFRAAPSGQPLATTALSFTKDSTTSSAFTLPLGPDGVSFRPSGTTSNTVHLVLDITAYVT